MPCASGCEVRRLGGSQRREAAPQCRGRGCRLCPFPGLPRRGRGGSPGRDRGRWSGATVKRLRERGSGAPTAAGPLLLAGAARPARRAAGALLGGARPSSACSASPAPRAFPHGRAATRPPASPSRCLCQAVALLARDLPGARHCRERRRWEVPAGQRLPVGASLGVRSQLPALWVRVAAVWEGCALLGALGTTDAGEKKINKQHLLGVVKAPACFFLHVMAPCFYFAYTMSENTTL